MYGNVRGVAFTEVTVTVGAAVWTVIDLAPLVPVFDAVSVCVAVTVYAPFAANALEKVYVHAPAVQGAVPFSELGPLAATATVAASPVAVPHAPPTDVAAAFVVNGNVRVVPLTVVSVTTGSVRSTVTA